MYFEHFLVVVNHRLVVGPGGHRWLAGATERREAQKTKLPSTFLHLPAISRNLISGKQTSSKQNIFSRFRLVSSVILQGIW